MIRIVSEDGISNNVKVTAETKDGKEVATVFPVKYGASITLTRDVVEANLPIAYLKMDICPGRANWLLPFDEYKQKTPIHSVTYEDSDCIVIEEGVPVYMPLGEALNIVYRNYKGEVSERSILPRHFYYGTSQYHEGTQWFLVAYDRGRGAMRHFALKDILEFLNP